ncbi:MAG: GBS Bsp-like repeat-containing protein, partial [Clostridia bacterium]|nr:GBS Bsp-like repeat-containing protein [Clostridia bacterium]
MKKVLSVILSLVMLLSITAGMSISAEAGTNGHSQSQAVSWASSQIGNSLDYDGAYGAQCVDLIYYYYVYLGQSSRGGNASAYVSNSLPSGWQRISYSSGITFKPGDIAVWNPNGTNNDGLGHIGIIESADSVGFNCIEQNWNYVQSVTKNWHNNSVLSCVIRPDWTSDTTKPVISNVSISGVNVNGYTVSCTVTDNVGVTDVKFPTWTKSDQSDLRWDSYTSKSGNTYSIRINTSTYNNYTGWYYTHIYAYDAAGNTSSYTATGHCYVQRETMLSECGSMVYNNKLYTLYDNTISRHDKAETYSSQFRLAEVGVDATTSTKDADIKAFKDFVAKGKKDEYYKLGIIKDSNKGWIYKYTGTGLNYTNWSPGEPEDKGENYAAMKKSAGTWVDTTYSYAMGMMMETTLDLTPTVTKYYNGNKYCYYEETFPYATTREWCKAKGGYLADISNSAENETIYELINEGNAGELVLIGADDIETEGTFKWANSGAKVSGYTNWASSQPDNASSYGGQDYAAMFTENGKWDDISDETAKRGKTHYGFVCEYDGTPEILVSDNTCSISEADVQTVMNYADGTTALFTPSSVDVET